MLFTRVNTAITCSLNLSDHAMTATYHNYCLLIQVVLEHDELASLIECLRTAILSCKV